MTWYVATLSAIVISVAAGIGSKGALKMLKLDVPQWADLRYPVTLNCQFDTGGDSLYSVKWYKDEHEFFRYTPGLSPKTLVFNMDGVKVDESKSTVNEVTLYSLTRMSKGNYKCEVSTDAPNFPTVVEDANMTIVVYPENVPRIEGLREMYAIGEFMEANCTAKMTYPMAQVTWYINNIEVHKSMLESYMPEISDGPLYNVTLGMRMQLKKDWVDVSRKVIDVKCTAKVDGADVKEDATTVRLRPLTDHTLSQERHIYNNTGVIVNKHWAIVLTTFVLHYYEVYN